MKTYIVHPVVDNHIWVTAKYKKGQKEVECIAFQIDCPGRWFDDKYNCHVDGCNYPFDTVEAALEHGAAVLRFNDEPFEFIHTEEVFDPYKKQL
jgi:hypothetical protein